MRFNPTTRGGALDLAGLPAGTLRRLTATGPDGRQIKGYLLLHDIVLLPR